MPVCFQLYRKEAEAAGPVILQKVDEELCAHFNAPCDEKKWLWDWYNGVGFSLACGKTFDEIRVQINKYAEEDAAKGDEEMFELDANLLKLVDYLEEHFTTNSFYSRFKD